MKDSERIFETRVLKPDTDYLTPDGSEIRLLSTMKGSGLCHCTLPAGKTSSPVAHQQVEEIWYVLEGGEVWHKASGAEETVCMSPGMSLTIRPRTAFEFRNTGDSPLCILIVKMPLWPSPQEAENAEGVWPVTAGAAADTGSTIIVTEMGAQSRERREHQ